MGGGGSHGRQISLRAGTIRFLLAGVALVLLPAAVPATRWFTWLLALYLGIAAVGQLAIWKGVGTPAARSLILGPIDLALITFIVHRVGSTPSPLSGVYVFVCLTYALVVPAPLALGLAVLASLSYCAVLVAEQAGVLPYAPDAPTWAAASLPAPAVAATSATILVLLLLGSSLVVARLAATLRGREAELEEQSRRDPLTNLFNRRHALEDLAGALARVRRGAPLAVMMIDLDGFKQVNDAAGHLRGDEVLVEVAAALRGATRETDVVARYGGDEFLVVAPDTTIERAEVAARRLLDRLREVGEARAGAPPVTASIGLAAAELDDDPARLVARADARCYAAKRAGGDRVAGVADIRH